MKDMKKEDRDETQESQSTRAFKLFFFLMMDQSTDAKKGIKQRTIRI